MSDSIAGYWTEDGDALYWNELEDLSEEFLNETFDCITVGDSTFFAGTVMRHMDSAGFRGAVLDYLDILTGDGHLVENLADLDSDEDE